MENNPESNFIQPPQYPIIDQNQQQQYPTSQGYPSDQQTQNTQQYPEQQQVEEQKQEVKQQQYNPDIQNQQISSQLQQPTGSNLMEKFNPFYQGHKSNIVIKVSDPILKESGMSSYTVYCIKGQDKNGEFEVYRRYNEFYTIREVLQQRWPGCFIPSIPPKTLVGKNDKSVVENRARALNYFCISMSENQNLYYTKEFSQDFLRFKDGDLSKLLQSQPVESPGQIVEKYKNCFSKLHGVVVSKEITDKIQNFSNFLKTARSQLSNFKNSFKSISDIQKTNNIYLYQLFDQQLPLYEKVCFSQYVQGDQNKLLLSSQIGNEKLANAKSNLKDLQCSNSLQYLDDLITFELRDCEAFIELIDQKNDYTKKQLSIDAKIKSDQEDMNKLQQGKKTLSSMMSGSDEAKRKLQLSIEQGKQELEQIICLNDIIVAMISTIEIENYKKSKQRWYKKVISSLSNLELVAYSSVLELWQQLHELSSNLHEN